ncbi:hypothetical protein Cyrtocomes_00452 [Candidatus Cyrtobacter comes]|uniref:Ubiquitin-like protease family profile domain-containing protein n=1 Tax=Candidatus Cyrtobacter comes TaxID=675776 RepID=A0ABU5L8B6_9RICK|nr:hypothetical protein [Candidatus Cyrtobacter comes]MDZ5762084.1 hypothetical protein [Candidatus Cyrtobacter comes]
MKYNGSENKTAGGLWRWDNDLNMLVLLEAVSSNSDKSYEEDNDQEIGHAIAYNHQMVPLGDFHQHINNEQVGYIEIIFLSKKLISLVTEKILNATIRPIGIGLVDCSFIINMDDIDPILDAIEDNTVNGHTLSLQSPMDDDAFKRVADLIQHVTHSLNINIHESSDISYTQLLKIAKALATAQTSHTINLTSILDGVATHNQPYHFDFFRKFVNANIAHTIQLAHTIRLARDKEIDFNFLANLPNGLTLDLSTIGDSSITEASMETLLSGLEQANSSLNIDLYGLFGEAFDHITNINFKTFATWLAKEQNIYHSITIGWGDTIADDTVEIIEHILKESRHTITLDMSRSQISFSDYALNCLYDAINNSAPEHRIKVLNGVVSDDYNINSAFFSAIREHALKSELYDKNGLYKNTGYYYNDIDIRNLIETLVGDNAAGTFANEHYIRVGSTYILRPASLSDDGNVARIIATQISEIVGDEDTSLPAARRILIPIRLENEAHWVTGEFIISENREISGQIYDSLGDARNDLVSATLAELQTMGGTSEDGGTGFYVTSTNAPSVNIYPIQAESQNVYCGGYTARLIANLAMMSETDLQNDAQRSDILMRREIWNIEYPDDDAMQRQLDRKIIDAYLPVQNVAHLDDDDMQMRIDIARNNHRSSNPLHQSPSISEKHDPIIEEHDSMSKEEDDQTESKGVSGPGMLDNEIRINLLLLKQFGNQYYHSSTCYVEGNILTKKNIESVFYSWEKDILGDYNNILALISVTNNHHEKHAVSLHISTHDHIIRIINTLPSINFDYELNEIRLRLETLFNGYSVVILNTDQQNLEHGTCADLSLINMSQIIEEINSDDTPKNSVTRKLTEKNKSDQFNSKFNADKHKVQKAMLKGDFDTVGIILSQYDEVHHMELLNIRYGETGFVMGRFVNTNEIESYVEADLRLFIEPSVNEVWDTFDAVFMSVDSL